MIKTIKHDPFLLYPLAGSLICIVAGSIFIGIYLKSLPSQVPLYYSLPHTSERLADKVFLFVLPLCALFFTLFNTSWTLYFVKKNPVLSRILAATSLIVSFLSFYTLLRIILLIV